jgi:hypothetical protein
MMSDNGAYDAYKVIMNMDKGATKYIRKYKVSLFQKLWKKKEIQT